MTNLLKETTDLLTANGKTGADVRWVGLIEAPWMLINKKSGKEPDPLPVGSWDDFVRFANFDYDAGYGGNEIAGDLVIVGDNWWLERGEYDGSEWWEFKTLPQPPAEKTPLRKSDLKNK